MTGNRRRQLPIEELRAEIVDVGEVDPNHGMPGGLHGGQVLERLFVAREHQPGKYPVIPVAAARAFPDDGEDPVTVLARALRD